MFGKPIWKELLLWWSCRLSKVSSYPSAPNVRPHFGPERSSHNSLCQMAAHFHRQFWHPGRWSTTWRDDILFASRGTWWINCIWGGFRVTWHACSVPFHRLKMLQIWCTIWRPPHYESFFFLFQFFTLLFVLYIDYPTPCEVWFFLKAPIFFRQFLANELFVNFCLMFLLVILNTVYCLTSQCVLFLRIWLLLKNFFMLSFLNIDRDC